MTDFEKSLEKIAAPADRLLIFCLKCQTWVLPKVTIVKPRYDRSADFSDVRLACSQCGLSGLYHQWKMKGLDKGVIPVIDELPHTP
jgi:RNase P subunit RPR2